MYETPWNQRVVHFENARWYDHLRELDHFTYQLTEKNSEITSKPLQELLDETSVENVLVRITDQVWKFHHQALDEYVAQNGREALIELSYRAGETEGDENPLKNLSLRDAFEKLKQTRTLWKSPARNLILVRATEKNLIFEIHFRDTYLNQTYFALYLKWIEGWLTRTLFERKIQFRVSHFSDYSQIEVYT